MTRSHNPEKWQPQWVDFLEPNADKVVRSVTHHCVLAGPGSGKTELLAQRACFLLETNICPSPQRILAISYKKDAARNLRERVQKRCDLELARRLDSYTFDAFAKGLLDRFRMSLPPQWLPTVDYVISDPSPEELDDFLGALDLTNPIVKYPRELLAIKTLRFQKEYVLGSSLPRDGFDPRDTLSWAASIWWEQMLFSGAPSRLTFGMLSRLVEMIFLTNPLLKRALQMTYSHVLIDEFQDTTHVQYSLIKTCFHGSKTTLTAVGDSKQKIMRWAMAMDDAFTAFEKDFGTKPIPLRYNFRSSKKLVRIQNHLALAMNSKNRKAKSMAKVKDVDDACVVLAFQDEKTEAKYIANEISTLINVHHLQPRDVGILVRQKPEDYDSLFISALSKRNVNSRNEADLQDLLSEPITELLLTFLHLGNTKRAGMYWSECLKTLVTIQGLYYNDKRASFVLHHQLDDFKRDIANRMTLISNDGFEITDIIDLILEFVGRDRIIASYPEYRNEDELNIIVSKCIEHLVLRWQLYKNWIQTLADFEGLDSVPIMTIHKSKGLEFDTVFVVGIEDEAWWNFIAQPEDEICAFFVAFSRAKRQVRFTYCASRGTIGNISSLYQILQDVHVPVREV